MESHTRHDDFVAALAAGRVLTGTAFPAHDLAIVFSCKRLIGQRLVALGTTEAVLMPVAVLMSQLLKMEGIIKMRTCLYLGISCLG